jgi:hypothetical protein
MSLLEIPPAALQELNKLPEHLIAEYLAHRVGLKSGLLRLQVKNGRYEHIRCTVSPDALAR